ncbi:hypothetical protein CAMSH0001_2383 [Campylobacter showae RM3277]|uniref:Uncharacterized protein n=1 Tax=Campylobacter showae RM3277 TaxID=553219 RepID=C6RCK8_9BACT|nr:hypothetical protein CAMSH0001_2383 [Campylobacter showae RM3277]
MLERIYPNLQLRLNARFIALGVSFARRRFVLALSDRSFANLRLTADKTYFSAVNLAQITHR